MGERYDLTRGQADRERYLHDDGENSREVLTTWAPGLGDAFAAAAEFIAELERAGVAVRGQALQAQPSYLRLADPDTVCRAAISVYYDTDIPGPGTPGDPALATASSKAEPV